uniref:Uncharacterized protein n=1 Tax=Parascaris univalens TaxID=6257 RepID=A0A915CJL5_PARUN
PSSQCIDITPADTTIREQISNTPNRSRLKGIFEGDQHYDINDHVQRTVPKMAIDISMHNLLNKKKKD